MKLLVVKSFHVSEWFRFFLFRWLIGPIQKAHWSYNILATVFTPKACLPHECHNQTLPFFFASLALTIRRACIGVNLRLLFLPPLTRAGSLKT